MIINDFLKFRYKAILYHILYLIFILVFIAFIFCYIYYLSVINII